MILSVFCEKVTAIWKFCCHSIVFGGGLATPAGAAGVAAGFAAAGVVGAAAEAAAGTLVTGGVVGAAVGAAGEWEANQARHADSAAHASQRNRAAPTVVRKTAIVTPPAKRPIASGRSKPLHRRVT